MLCLNFLSTFITTNERFVQSSVQDTSEMPLDLSVKVNGETSVRETCSEASTDDHSSPGSCRAKKPAIDEDLVRLPLKHRSVFASTRVLPFAPFPYTLPIPLL